MEIFSMYDVTGMHTHLIKTPQLDDFLHPYYNNEYPTCIQGAAYIRRGIEESRIGDSQRRKV